jgi:WD40 repeat protein
MESDNNKIQPKRSRYVILVRRGFEQNWVIYDKQDKLLATLHYFFRHNKVTSIKDLRNIIAAYVWNNCQVAKRISQLALQYVQEMGEPRTIIDHDAIVNTLCLSKDSKHLLVGGCNLISSWNMENPNAPYKEGSGFPASGTNSWIYVTSLSMSNDNCYCALGGYDAYIFNQRGVVQLWDMSNAHQEMRKKQDNLIQSAQVNIVNFNADSCYLLAGSQDHTITLWDVGNKINPQQLTILASDSDIQSAVFSNDSNYIVAGGWQNVTIWNVHDKHKPQVLRSFKAHEGSVQTIALDPRSNYMCTGSHRVTSDRSQETIKLWDITDQKNPKVCDKAFSIKPPDVLAITYSSDGEYVATRTKVASYVWKKNKDDSLTCLGRFDSHKGTSPALCIARSGRYLASSIPNTQAVGVSDFSELEWIENKAGLGHYLLLQELIAEKASGGKPYALTHPQLREIFDSLPNNIRFALQKYQYVEC